jgi:hypothetical protein
MESSGPCPSCGVEVVVPSNLLSALRSNKREFFCVNGHPQSFREREVDRLQRQLEIEQAARRRAEELRQAALAEAETARRGAAVASGRLRALKQRVKNGVCPCCHRSFVQLQRHIATKHPEFAAEPKRLGPGEPTD